ncbi:MAG TPA: hypothetical protein PLJ94_07685 [Methylotenera sp.]|nr:hypothetical protein [Methylotenera sp.]HPH08543.1 hypothetical protein [Methylotenera sp.]HPM48677.1 hypothetical protein [Methylotenera sp.]
MGENPHTAQQLIIFWKFKVMKHLKQVFIPLIFLLIPFFCTSANAQLGFVALPKSKNTQSAYVQCNSSGEFGLKAAETPTTDGHSTCAVITNELKKSPTSAPLEGFRLVGVLVSDVEMPKPDVGNIPAVAVLTDAIWRNKENTECILGTHLQLKDAPLANGQYWEVNDIARGGFAGKEVSIAYFYKIPAAEIGGGAEVLFRAGRTFTSVKTSPDEKLLPVTQGTPAVNTPINKKNTAAYSDNWVDFTTDISFKDLDGVTRQNSSIYYIKYACDARDPVSKPNAIRFRTTGQSGQKTFEITAPALVPVDSQVEKY